MLLDFLSGDNYVAQSVEVTDDSSQFIKRALGMESAFTTKFRDHYAA